MMNVTVSINNGSGKTTLRSFANVLPARLKRGLYKAGLVFERDAKKKLSGRSHSDFKTLSRLPSLGGSIGLNNPFPGVVTGTLRRSVTTVGSVTEVVIGPGGLATPYAAIHEFGGRAGRNRAAVIPARPYMQPALEAQHDKAFEVLATEITADV